MSTHKVAHELVKLCSEGKFAEAMELYSPDIVSMEAGAPPGQSRETKGLEAVKAKGEWWQANHEVHSAKVEGPLVAGSHFAVTFKMDFTFKPQSKRMQMEEIAVYKVVDGKIVYEEFFYNM
jgi:ketosteroid isomerase-like protein